MDHMARVLITGCSTGIGRAAAVELTERGHHVSATARRLESLADLDVAARLTLDVDDEGSIADAVAAAGDVEALVNNAGYAVVGPVERADLEEVRAMFETNVFGLARMIQAVVPQLRARGSGTVVNIGSLAGVVAGPLAGYYSATKHAVEAITESLHYEIGHFGVRAVVVEPGAIDTDFGANERHSGEDTPPYDELRREWDAAGDKLTGGNPPGPELVAVAIADAIEADDPPLRIPVGEDAEMVVAVRESSDDAAFEATMRETLGLSW
jgi:NADP-dependent 3-hydroxy acid dehydrogenase YdfG